MYQVARNMPYIVLNKTQVTLKNKHTYKIFVKLHVENSCFPFKSSTLFSFSLLPSTPFILSVSISLSLSLFLLSFLSLFLSGLEQYLSDTLVIEL